MRSLLGYPNLRVPSVTQEEGEDYLLHRLIHHLLHPTAAVPVHQKRTDDKEKEDTRKIRAATGFGCL